MARYINTEGARIYVSDFVCEQMKKIPTADVVSVDACKQISKEAVLKTQEQKLMLRS